MKMDKKIVRKIIAISVVVILIVNLILLGLKKIPVNIFWFIVAGGFLINFLLKYYYKDKEIQKKK